MASTFIFDDTYKLIICQSCQTSLPPTRTGQTRHLRLPQHGIKGSELTTLLDVFDGYGPLRPQDLPLRHTLTPRSVIDGLRIERLFSCSHCILFPCTKTLRRLVTHISGLHEIAARDQAEGTDWRLIQAQTLYSEKQHLRYFEVKSPPVLDPPTLEDVDPNVSNFFQQLSVKRELEKLEKLDKVAVVEGFEAHKSEAIPWLQRTGISSHLRHLPVDKVLESYQLNPNQETPWLAALLEATDIVLQEAYASVLPGKDCQMTYATSLAMCQVSHLQMLDGHPHSFLSVKQPGTIKAYFRYWRQFMVYYERLVFSEQEYGESFWFSDHPQPEGASIPTFNHEEVELMVYEHIMELPTSDLPQEESTQRLVAELPSFFKSLICSEPGGNSFGSILVSYAAMLSMKPTTKTWKEPGDFSSNLSGIIWVSQLLLFHYCSLDAQKHAELNPESNQQSTNKLVRALFQRSGRQDSESALGQLLNWRDLLFSVSKDTMKVREAIWNRDQTVLTYSAISLAMTDVTKIMASEFRKAYDALYQELLLASGGLLRMKADMLKDNLRHVTVDESLLDVCHLVVPQHCLEMEIQRSSQLRHSFLTETSTSTMEWNDKAINHYEAIVQKFLQHLLVLIHMGAGQPLRSPELLSTKWKNTQNQARSIFILHNRVMMRINYHKGLQHTGKIKDNMRFLPPPIGQLLLDFLVHVQPLRQEFLTQNSPGQTLSPYLWEKGGEVWDDTKVSTALERASVAAQAPKLKVATWRQFTVAIVKAKFGSEIHCFDVAPGDEARDDDEAHADLRAMHQQRNHTSFTANISYANQHSFGGISDEFIQRSYRASELWSSLFHLDSSLEKLQKRPNPESDQDNYQADAGTLLKRINGSKPVKSKTYTNSELLQTARGMMNQPKLQWRSSHQSRSMDLVMSGAEVVIAILPTGGGKSMLFMLPCKLEEAQTTILILPLISLRGDMLRRLRELRIQTELWKPESRPTAKLVMVTAEAACTSDFQAYCLTLINTQRLDRIVVDECHLTVTTSTYRSSMAQLAGIRMLATRFLYLTATLPPTLEIQFKEQNFLGAARVVRASADRPNICYNIQVISATKPFIRQAAHLIAKILEKDKMTKFNILEDKVLVYCTTIKTADEVAKLLGCASYTSQSGSVQQKEMILGTWLDNRNNPILVATSALSVGFDYPHVRRVYHVGPPRSLIDFAQEAGRGGRDGELAVSTVYVHGGSLDKPDLTPIERYLHTNDCLRRQLSLYLDSEDCQVSPCGQDRNSCVRCRKQQAAGNNTKSPATRKAPSAIPSIIPSIEEDDPLIDIPQEPEASYVGTGASLIRLRAKEEAEQLARFTDDLLVLQNTCVICRVRNKPFNHLFDSCQNRWPYLRSKSRRQQISRHKWLEPFSACFRCHLPQTICQKAFTTLTSTATSSQQECEYRDLLMPYCYAAFMYDFDWVQAMAKADGVVLVEGSGVPYLDWLGTAVKFGGEDAIMAVVVMAKRLSIVRLY